MRIAPAAVFAAVLMAGVSGTALAQSETGVSDAQAGPYYKADGSRTSDYEEALESWRQDPQFAVDYSKRYLGLEHAYARGLSGKGVTVGINDSGVFSQHPLFQGDGKFLGLRTGIPDGYGNDGLINPRTPWESHGTHVAGTAAGNRVAGEIMFGNAFNARVYSATINFAAGDFRWFLDEGINDVRVFSGMQNIAGLVDTGVVRIINNSWGSSTSLPVNSTIEAVRNSFRASVESDFTEELKNKIIDNDVLLVWAAGNHGGVHASSRASAPLLDERLRSNWLSVANYKEDLTASTEFSTSLCGQTATFCVAGPGHEIISSVPGFEWDIAAFRAAFPINSFRSIYAAGTITALNNAVNNMYVAVLNDYLNRKRAAGANWTAADEEAARNRAAEQAVAIALSAGSRVGDPGFATQIPASLLAGNANLLTVEFSRAVLEKADAEIARVLGLFARQTGPDYNSKGGTSMAAPNISGFAALLVENFPEYNTALITDILLSSSLDLDEEGVDIRSGWGAPQMGVALNGPTALRAVRDANVGADTIDIWSNDIGDARNRYSAAVLENFPDDIGGIVKIGAGTLALTGTNSYTGGTTISEGTLQLGNGGTTGSIAGDVLNNATLAFNRSDVATFGGIISGTGAVHQIGSGTTILTAANDYNGGTLIGAGTLQLGDGGTTGSITGDVVNNAALAFNRSDEAIFAGNISGTGSVDQIGSGTTVLTGDATHGGGTTISAGTLQLGDGGSSGSLTGDVVNNSILAFNRADAAAFTGNITGTGAVDQIGSGTTILTGDASHSGGTRISAGTLQLGDGGTRGSIAGDIANEGMLAFNRSDIVTFANVISGTGGVRQFGPGVTILTGISDYTGGTLVENGVLMVNGQLTGSTVTVARPSTSDSGEQMARAEAGSGILSGTGQIFGLVAGEGGIVSPGTVDIPFGALRVTGDVNFQAGSSLWIRSAINAGQYSYLDIGGQTQLDGGDVVLGADGGVWNIRTRLDIVRSAGGVSGTFDGVRTNLGFLTPTLSYGADLVTLTLLRNDVPFASVGRTANQQATGQGLDGLPAAGALYDALVDGSVENVRRSLDSLSGEVHAGVAAVAVNDTMFVRDAMLRRMPHSTMVLDGANTRGAEENRTSSGVVAWGQAIAGFDEHDGSADVARVKTETTGFMTGIDKTSDENFNLGIAFGYLDSGVNLFRPGSGNNNVRSWHVGGYAGAEMGALRVRAGGSWGWYTSRTGRLATVNAFNDSLRSKCKGRAWQAFGELGLGFEAGSLSFEPYANVTHVDYRSKDFAEIGGAAALNGQSEQKVTWSTLGLRTAARLDGGGDGRGAFARVNMGWRHDLDNDGATARLAFPDATSAFVVTGAIPGKDVFVTDIALDLAMTPNLDFGFNYGGQTTGKYMAHSVKATLQLRF